ncbi:hypothetical protein D3P96_03510 [Weissella viridescens]|uniref:Uncharacterized protein n=1 Tax=Weissella viridescens TaxID=1629 RepID=A0A3P2RCQ6_WEIVI|nr:hypothetical protein [Weissella viridescens]RRG18364.1 hypothetical protein D3P96_03510 [Weissella viridescens]
MFKGVKQLFGNATQAITLNTKALVLRVKGVQVSSKELSEAMDNLKEAMPLVEQTSKDLQKSVNKMNFKNKPHLERIDEAKARIDGELATINQMLTFKKKKS